MVDANGQRRKLVSSMPWQLAEKVADLSTSPGGATVSVVFGNEQSGLSDAELELCHMAVSIPSSRDFPSLNLSHAVQVIAYELYIARLGGRASAGYQPIDSRELAGDIARCL